MYNKARKTCQHWYMSMKIGKLLECITICDGIKVISTIHICFPISTYLVERQNVTNNKKMITTWLFLF